MDASAKIKMRIADHEFEAEGPTEVVQAQLEIFRSLIATLPQPSSHVVQLPETVEDQRRSLVPSGDSAHVPLNEIMNADGRVVSLTALPATVEDAVLLLMLGQRDLRNNISVTGQEIGDGLNQSGKPTSRVDRTMEKHMRDALILKTGLGRATRYRLTNQGLNRSLAVARELIATLA